MNKHLYRDWMLARTDEELREIVRRRAAEQSDEAIAAAWNELRIRGITGVPGADARALAVSDAADLPTRWLTFYTYFLPTGAAVRCLRQLLQGAPTNAAITFVSLLLPFSVLAYGLYRRRLWGYRLNILFLAVDLVGCALVGLRQPLAGAVLVGFVLLLTWANYVYFKKRIHLFT
ncbi:MAG: hypothetical protein JWM53_7009 [bacterium]|nr:hypothetical protein [bacterium]